MAGLYIAEHTPSYLLIHLPVSNTNASDGFVPPLVLTMLLVVIFCLTPRPQFRTQPLQDHLLQHLHTLVTFSLLRPDRDMPPIQPWGIAHPQHMILRDPCLCKRSLQLPSAA